MPSFVVPPSGVSFSAPFSRLVKREILGLKGALFPYAERWFLKRIKNEGQPGACGVSFQVVGVCQRKEPPNEQGDRKDGVTSIFCLECLVITTSIELATSKIGPS